MKSKYLIILLTTILSILPVHSQIVDPVYESIVENYTPWQSAEFGGKLRSDRLPVSPTIKMYMVRDSLLQVSVRAPFVGEVARLDLSKTRIMIINKMKKTYVDEPSDNLFSMYPGALADLQSIFLARAVLFGDGELTAGSYESLTMQSDGEGNWVIVPAGDLSPSIMSYGYVLAPNGRILSLVADMAGKANLQIDYTFDNGEKMAMTLSRPDKSPVNASLDFNTVKWGGTEMSPVRTDSYRKVTLKEMLGSIL